MPSIAGKGDTHNMRCGGLQPPHRMCFPLRPALPGFVHFPLQRRDVGKGAEHVGAVQAVAHRFLTGDPPQMAERAASLFHAVERGEPQFTELTRLADKLRNSPRISRTGTNFISSNSCKFVQFVAKKTVTIQASSPLPFAGQLRAVVLQ